ncbi:MAG: hypothetical protein AAGE85_16600 [Pseudomonadota bacterium]
MNFTFLETPVFTRLITRLLEDEEYRRLQEFLIVSPAAGDIIPGTSGCRKLRWRVSRRKGGKSGGMRIIYYFRCSADQIIFLLAYDHRVKDDLRSAQKRQVADIVRRI